MLALHQFSAILFDSFQEAKPDAFPVLGKLHFVKSLISSSELIMLWNSQEYSIRLGVSLHPLDMPWRVLLEVFPIGESTDTSGLYFDTLPVWEREVPLPVDFVKVGSLNDQGKVIASRVIEALGTFS